MTTVSNSRRDLRRPTGTLSTSIDIAPRRALGVSGILVTEILLVTGLIVAVATAARGWHGLLAGAVIAAGVLIPFRGHTAPQWLRKRWRFVHERRRRATRKPFADPFDMTLPDGSPIGFRWDGTTLLSLIKIEANPQAMTVLEPGVTVSGDVVPVQALVELLRQFDITVDSIDVISQGSRSLGHTDVAAVYDAVLGPLPAIAHRSVWIAVRFDPSLCADAVRRRGGGRDGLLRTAATATRRVANRLTEEGLRPTILPASGMATAASHLADGVNVATVQETWDDCREGRFRLRSFAVYAEMMTTAGLGSLWTVPSYSTTVTLSLRNADEPALISARAIVRFDGEAPPDGTRTPLNGLARLPGEQYNALAASLPIPAPTHDLGHWAYGRRDTDLRELAVPASGCGQVVGADDNGRAVALPLFGSQVDRVEISGSLHLAQQVVLRSLALGSRTLVHTNRPAMWREMVDQVGRHDLLWVADFNRAALQAGSERNFSVEVFDRVAEQPVRVGVTTIVVAPPGVPVSPAAAVSLEQVSAQGRVKVSTPAGTVFVTMVATDEESRYLRSATRDQPPEPVTDRRAGAVARTALR